MVLSLPINTWDDLGPPPPHANIVLGKWLYRHKPNADGSLLTVDKYPF
jgi:hypothetical protein